MFIRNKSYFLGIFAFQKFNIFKRRNHYVNTERMLYCLPTADSQITHCSLKEILFNGRKLRFPDSLKFSATP